MARVQTCWQSPFIYFSWMKRYLLFAAAIGAGILCLHELHAENQTVGSPVPGHHPLSPEDAAAYDGHFVAGPFEYTVTHDGGQLYISFDGNAKVTILPIGPDQFSYQRLHGTVAFIRGGDGKVATLDQSFGPVRLVARRQSVASNPSVSGNPPPVLEHSYLYHNPVEPTYRDLAYATESPAEKLDLYLPASAQHPCPVVIWMHGGGFAVGDKQSMPRRNFGPPPIPIGPSGPFQIQVPDAAALMEKGYAVVSLNYRLLGMRQGEKFRVFATAAVQDAKAAVRFLRANATKYNLDPNRFAVWGNSAGGYMAAMLGVTGDQASRFDSPELGNPSVSSAVQAVVVWYGAVDNAGLLPEVRFPNYLPTAKIVPPFLIANGDADRNVSVEIAQQFDQLLRKHGHESTLVILPGASHEDPAFMATQMEPTFRFLDGVFGRSVVARNSNPGRPHSSIISVAGAFRGAK
jgi:acetyl esterase/lipase